MLTFFGRSICIILEIKPLTIHKTRKERRKIFSKIKRFSWSSKLLFVVF